MIGFSAVSNRYFGDKPFLVSVDREYEVMGNIF
jgi:hypothetical protein